MTLTNNISTTPRSEYVLYPFGGNLASKQVLLNDNTTPLGIDNGIITPIVPKVITDSTIPLIFQPRSYGYIVLSNANIDICK